ncbi:MAG: polysaccharide deacetylase family protein [Bacteroidetes bacterium]|nr:polysaccharide deacetylase family protein [Bacteroidota bacterium]
MSGLSGQNTIFPFYHVASDQQLPHLKHLYRYRNEAQFERDIEQLLSSFEPISITDFLEGDPGPGSKRRMVLSFDDGLAECHSFIAPFLKRKGIPAVFFLNNDFIDNRGLFYRYKASILVEYLQNERAALIKAAEFLIIPEQQVKDAILMSNHRQIPLLDALSLHVGLDYAVYQRDQPVYMTTEQVQHLVKLGFHMGAHSMDHPEFFRMEEKKMEANVSMSMEDIRKRFTVKPACFAFPFTSDGIPERVIDEILAEGIADVIFGTAGLKRTGKRRFIQRIPMEAYAMDAKQALKAEYLAYLFKGLMGKNGYF